MNIAINGIGLATAQGSAADIVEAGEPQSHAELPWAPSKWSVSKSCYPALGIDSSLSGAARWRALARKALADLGPLSARTPLLVASCNGSAAGFQAQSWEEAFDTSVLLEDTPWSNEGLPVFSSSCASGIHALYAAKQLLMTSAVDEVLVLAVDILSQSNHENFESLRVLAEKPGLPWQSSSTGFILGEAAVVLKLARAEGNRFPLIKDVDLASDLLDHDGLASVLQSLSLQSASLILGQGTGPFQNDSVELSTFSDHIDKNVPLATPLSNFGHTLGASGLLAIALAALTQQTRSAIRSLTTSASLAHDGRPFLNGTRPSGEVLATCRALNGACGATVVSSNLTPAKPQATKVNWRNTGTPGPLMNQTLKRLASEALNHRPLHPPDVLILRLEKPLSPPPQAIIGDRLLPSAVLEITPGFTSQLIARCWGFSGPALCLAGDVDHDVYGLKTAFSESGLNVFQVNQRGSGDNRVIEWNV